MTTNRNCTECGTVAEPGQSFCDACGAVLSWTGTNEQPAQQPPADAGSAAPAWDAFTRRDGGTGLPQRDARTTTATAPAEPPAPAPLQGHGDPSTPPAPAPLQGHGDPSTPPTAAPLQGHGDPSAPPTTAPLQGRGELRDQPPPTATSPTAETTPLPTSLPTPHPQPEAGGPAPTPEQERARRLLIPVSEPTPTPAPQPIAPVLPGRPTPQRPAAVRAPGEDLGAHGGTPCPWCATPNRPDRHFCTRCAMPMAGHPDTGPAARRPWWRRIFDFRHRETPWAGDRPRLRRTFDRVLTWIVAAVVLTGVTVLAINTPKAVSATRDHFAKRAPVSPDSYRASRAYAGHKPELLFDKLNNTWWGPGIAGAGEGEWVEAHFDEPVRLLNVVITSGESTHNEQLNKSALPHRLTATIKTSDGKTETRELTLDQAAGGQTRDLRAADVVSVRFTIDSSYQTSTRTQVAIAEIEFFGPSSANS
ncbi:NADase-type glycan-binding domain-containing protein [Streptomyces sp. NPDC090499]|uniref:zinc ribbon domain-containing protein n=1 Tax=Streptomyces sp. NPDC090499 TaxID=3365965 RepID=UPI00382EAFC3